MLKISNKIINMLKEKFDFSKFRSNKQAVIFFLVHFFFHIIAAFILGQVAGSLNPNLAGETEGIDSILETAIFTYQVGFVFRISYVCIISGLIIYKKNLMKKFKYILLFIFIFGISVIGLSPIGLMFSSFLTTRNQEQ